MYSKIAALWCSSQQFKLWCKTPTKAVSANNAKTNYDVSRIAAVMTKSMWWGEGHYYPLFSIQRSVRQVRGFGGPRHLNPVLAPTPPFLLWWTIVDINKPRHSVLNEGKGSQNHSFCQSESAAPGNIIQFNQSGRSQVSSGNDCTCSGGCDSSICWSWGC